MAKLTGSERIRQFAHEIRAASGVAGRRVEDCTIWIMSEVQEDGETCPAIMQLHGMLLAITEMCYACQCLTRDLIALTKDPSTTPSLMPIAEKPVFTRKDFARYELLPDSEQGDKA